MNVQKLCSAKKISMCLSSHPQEVLISFWRAGISRAAATACPIPGGHTGKLASPYPAVLIKAAPILGAAEKSSPQPLHQSGIFQRGRQQQLSPAPSLILQQTAPSTGSAANPGCLVPIPLQILTAWVGGKLPELLPHLLKWAEIQS